MDYTQTPSLSKKLLAVDVAEFNHDDLTSVMKEISKLSVSKQNSLIYESLHVSYTFHQLMEYVRQQFFILYQEDEEGPYSALTFGNECIGICTWEGHEDVPSDLDNAYYFENTHENLLTFIEFWVDYYETTLEDFFHDLDLPIKVMSAPPSFEQVVAKLKSSGVPFNSSTIQKLCGCGGGNEKNNMSDLYVQKMCGCGGHSEDGGKPSLPQRKIN